MQFRTPTKQARLAKLVPDQFYHIFNRTNSRETLFYDHQDHRYFLKQYKRFVAPYVHTYSFCLIPNHFHFAVSIKSANVLIRLSAQTPEELRTSPQKKLLAALAAGLGAQGVETATQTTDLGAQATGKPIDGLARINALQKGDFGLGAGGSSDGLGKEASGITSQLNALSENTSGVPTQLNALRRSEAGGNALLNDLIANGSGTDAQLNDLGKNAAGATTQLSDVAKNNTEILPVILDSKSFYLFHDVVERQFTRLFTAYAMYFNKKYHRSGNLFYRPFKRLLITDERYLRYLIYYIHLNPRNHGVCHDFASFQWSSFHALCSDLPTLLDRAFVLDLFGGVDGFLAFHQADGSPGLDVDMED